MNNSLFNFKFKADNSTDFQKIENRYTSKNVENITRFCKFCANIWLPIAGFAAKGDTL